MPKITDDKFHWARRVPRSDIQRLYESDALGLLDVDLLEKVSFGIYTRIRDMLELREAQTFGRVHCRSCGAQVPQRFRMGSQGKTEPLGCDACGWQVTCGEYYDSYTGQRLLPGAATAVFVQFMERWPAVRTPQEKMVLIDWLIHQFHINQGIAGRPVGENVIQGSARQVSELIAGLACGPAAAANRPETQSGPGARPDAWEETFNDPIRVFRRSHSYAEVLEIAARLGIQGRSRMREDQLVAEIRRLAPDLFSETGRRNS